MQTAPPNVWVDEFCVTPSQALLFDENQARTTHCIILHGRIVYLSLAWNFRKSACSC